MPQCGNKSLLQLKIHLMGPDMDRGVWWAPKRVRLDLVIKQQKESSRDLVDMKDFDPQ